MHIHAHKGFIFTYGALLSAICGAILGGFYLLQGWLIEWVWPGSYFRPLFNAVWLGIVGTLIYWTQRTTGQLPKSLGLIRADLRHVGTSSYKFVWLQMLIPAIMLTSGTSLGPEATLVSSTVLYGLWITDKMRYLEQHYAEIRSNGFMQLLRVCMTPHRYRTPRPASARHQSLWSPLTAAYLTIGIVCFYLTCKFGGEPSVIVYLGHSKLTATDLVWLLPLVIIGWLTGRFYLKGMVLLRKVLTNRVRSNIGLLIVGAIAIYCATLFAPAINFSGMHNFHLLATTWQSQGIGFLWCQSILKLGLLTICLNTGWLGGDIFPVLFSATAQGIAVAHLLPSVDLVMAIGVIAISMGGTILESPLVAGGVMGVMFLPPNLLPVVITTTGILWLLGRGRQYLRDQFGDQFALLREL